MGYVNVKQMACARENRQNKQLKMITENKNALISFTLNIPGPEKDNETFREIHNAGVLAIIGTFGESIEKREDFLGETGSESYFSISQAPLNIKEKTIEIESNHPLGRIFDMDVIRVNGRSVSRIEINHPPRKCLLCDKQATICSRSRTHSVDELLKEIYRMHNGYKKN
jgi:holo-ACP synthase